MSQRSHIAQSGSIAISACSAACSVPSSFGIASSPSSCRGSGDEPDRLGGERRRRAARAATSSIRSCERDRLALVADDLLGHLDLAEDERRGPGAALLAQRPHDLGLRLVLRLRVPVAAERLDDRAHRSSRRARARGTTRRGAGRRRPRAPSSRRASARRGRAPRRSTRRRPRTRRGSAERRATRAAG